MYPEYKMSVFILPDENTVSNAFSKSNKIYKKSSSLKASFKDDDKIKIFCLLRPITFFKTNQRF